MAHYTFTPHQTSNSWKFKLQVIATNNNINRDLFAVERDFFMGISRSFRRGLLVGDINGDGKTDIMVTPSCTLLADSDYSYRMREFAWRILISKGNGTFDYSTDSELMGISTMLRGINTDGGAFLQDMNGDGRADIVSVDANKITIHYSNGKGFTNDNYQVIEKPSRFEGFVTSVDVLSTNNTRFLAYSQHNKINLANFARDEQKEAFLRNIDLTYIDYERIDNSGEIGYGYFYDLGSQRATFPYVNIQYDPLYVVKKIKTGLINNDYLYTNAVIHCQGLGFCGFEKIETRDNIRGLTTSETYDPLRFGLLKKTETPMQSMENTWSITESSTYPRVNKISLAKQKNTDKLTDNIQEVEYQYDNYVLPILQTAKQGTLKEDITTAYEYFTGTDWAILPKTKTSVKTYNGITINNVSVTDYNTLKLPVKITLKTGAAKDKIVSEDSFEYNTFGSITKHTNKAFVTGDNLIKQYAYSSNGRFLEKEINELGQTTTFTYDDIKGYVLSEKDFKNNTTTYTYDKIGRIISIRFPDVTQNITYTGPKDSPKQTITERGKPTVEITYDRYMRKTSKSEENFTGEMLSSLIEYNGKGQVYKVSEPGSTSRFTTYTYDAYGRPISITEPSGKVTNYAYSGKSTTVSESGYSKTTTINSEGFTTKVTDPAGDINYTYRPDGQLVKITAPDGAVTTFTYDDYSRQTSITDPTAGTIKYEYDRNGNMYKQTDARGRVTETTFNQYALPVTSVVKNGSTTEHTTNYSYNTDYALQSVTAGGTAISYTYDNLMRIASQTESIAGNSLTQTYTYAWGKLERIAYSGLTGTQPDDITYTYKNWGDLLYVKSGSTTVKTVNAKNNFRQTTQYTLGNGVVNYKNFDANGIITGIKDAKGAVIVQDLSYNIDPLKMVMTSRKDNVRNHTETFTYDSQQRLTGFTRPGQTAAAVTYSPMGNITAKTDAGTLAYNIADKPYAISQQTGNPGSVPARLQQVSYTGFNRPAGITENGYNVTFTYGPGYERNKMEVRKNSALQYTRYYLGGSYEKDVAGSTVTERLYINGTPYNAPAVYIRVNNGAWNLHYIHRDHLGSITAITNATGTKVEENSFDPWGRQRRVDNKTAYAPDQAPALMLGRGYTGHEHLPMFGLININARLYDPVLGRFLSADPYVQAPDWSQNFNRYSYCVNNPLIYVDESGELFGIDDLITGAIGGLINLGTNIVQGNIHGNFWECVGKGAAAFGSGFVAGATVTYGPAAWAASGALVGATNSWLGGAQGWDIAKGAGIGAVTSVVGGYAGQWASGIGSTLLNNLSISSQSLIGGAVNGAISGFVSSGASGFVGGYLMTGDFNEAIKYGWQGGYNGLLFGTVSGSYNGVKAARANGTDLLTGKKYLSLEDRYSLIGAKWKDVEKLIPDDWIKSDLKKGAGIKFTDPQNARNQILLEKGSPKSNDPTGLHKGSYIKFSSSGKISRFPISGNPSLNNAPLDKLLHYE